MGEIFLIIFVSLLLLIGLFLLMREIMMWYWKINKIISLLEQNNEFLHTLITKNYIQLSDDTLEQKEVQNDKNNDSLKIKTKSLIDYFDNCDKNKPDLDMIRGTIVTLSMRDNWNEIIDNYQILKGVSLETTINSILSKAKDVNYALEPLIKKGFKTNL